MRSVAAGGAGEAVHRSRRYGWRCWRPGRHRRGCCRRGRGWQPSPTWCCAISSIDLTPLDTDPRPSSANTLRRLDVTSSALTGQAALPRPDRGRGRPDSLQRRRRRGLSQPCRSPGRSRRRSRVLSRSLAAELAPRVRSNGIAPTLTVRPWGRFHRQMALAEGHRAASIRWPGWASPTIWPGGGPAAGPHRALHHR